MRSIVVLIAICKAANAEDDVDVAGRESTQLRGDAMVWEDAPLYLEPSDAGTMVRFSTFGRVRRDEVSRALPVKIVSAALRDFVEVELVEAGTCAPQSARIDRRITGLHLFVKRTDLAPVLVKPFTASYGDGTSVRLRAGVPVAPTASGAYLVGARGDVLRLPIPHGSVGFTYTRTKVDVPPLPKGQLWRLSTDRTLNVKLGDEEFEARAGWLATKPDKHGETVNVRWSTRCIELVVGVPAKSLRKATRPGGEIYGSGLGGGTAQHVIPRGTPLSTFTGREVAIAAADIDVVPSAEIGKACFDATLELARLDELGSGLRRPFRLCAPLSALEGPPVTATASTTPSDPLAPPPDVGAPPRDARRTAKGVYWKQLIKGKGGPKPTEDSTVLVHYTGWTTDGTMFDSTHKRGQPARFPLRAVIAGWTDGLHTMSVGDKTRLWIPEELAYKGAPGPPQGMLVFDVELLSID